MGLVLCHWTLIRRGVESALAGYAVLVAAAAATMGVLVATGETTGQVLASNSEVQHLAHPQLPELLVAAAGALAGVVMLAAFRRSFQAGPLIAMAFIPAVALIGAGLVVGRLDLTGQGLERFLVDWGFIIALGVPFLWLKQRLVHRRAPLV